jgi:hypothetical protein
MPQATRRILLDGGAEIVFEPARLWADLGTFVPETNGTSASKSSLAQRSTARLVNKNF